MAGFNEDKQDLAKLLEKIARKAMRVIREMGEHGDSRNLLCLVDV